MNKFSLIAAAAGLACLVSLSLVSAADETDEDLTRLLKLPKHMCLLRLRAPSWPGIGQFLQLVDPAYRIVNRLRIANRLVAYLKPDRIGECLGIAYIQRKSFI